MNGLSKRMSCFPEKDLQQPTHTSYKQAVHKFVLTVQYRLMRAFCESTLPHRHASWMSVSRVGQWEVMTEHKTNQLQQKATQHTLPIRGIECAPNSVWLAHPLADSSRMTSPDLWIDLPFASCREMWLPALPSESLWYCRAKCNTHHDWSHVIKQLVSNYKIKGNQL